MNLHSKQVIKNFIIYALLGSILFIMQIALKSVPNVEIVSLLIFIYAYKLKLKSLYPIYLFVILEGFLYGFGPWWFGYLYVWLILALVPIIFSKQKFNPLIVALILGIYGLLFGFFFSIGHAFLYGINSGIAYFISGVVYDIIHGVSNYVIGLVLFNPISKTFNKLNLAKSEEM